MAKISQFAKKVINFSSQYGTQGSRTYTACNLAGGLNIYDGYGDRTEAFVLVCLSDVATYDQVCILPNSALMDHGGRSVHQRLEPLSLHLSHLLAKTSLVRKMLPI